MDKNSLLRKLLNRKEAKDYTYAVLFLLISSFFTIFAIRPALSIAFALNRQAYDLTNINNAYEDNLTKLVDLQSTLEQIRDKVYLLDTAAPHFPETKTLIDDIKQSASQEGILIKKLDLSSVDLKNSSPSPNLQELTVNMETSGDFNAIYAFVNRLTDQRRIKTIKNLKIFNNDIISSSSANLKIILQIEGYYL